MSIRKELGLTLKEAQGLIARTYGRRDAARGREGTFLWFIEEVGELAESLRRGSPASMREEFADVLAWLFSVAELYGVDLGEAFEAKYGRGCPRCRRSPCRCRDTTKKRS